MQRFEDKYFIALDGCWIWTAKINERGYGVFWLAGKNRKAHRVSYELHVQRIPEGMQIDHLCRQPACVNPHHLEVVTQKENNRRKPGVKICEHDVGHTQCRQGCAREYWRTGPNKFNAL